MTNRHPISESKNGWQTNSKLLLRSLLISLIFNGIFLSFLVVKRFYFQYLRPHKKAIAANIELDPTYIAQRKARTEFLQILPHETDEIVFVGNSITEAFPLQEMFHNLKIKNRGIAGNTSKDILKQMPSIVSAMPKKIFLEVGFNDIQRKISLDTFLNNLQMINDVIKKGTPGTKIYTQSLLPTGLGIKSLETKIESYNEKMRGYCSLHNIRFINLYPFFLKDNSLDTSLTYDGVHLKAKGYFLWKELIEKYVDE